MMYDDFSQEAFREWFRSLTLEQQRCFVRQLREAAADLGVEVNAESVLAKDALHFDAGRFPHLTLN